ncbi:transketolase [Flavobacteriaceae bacterium UJ101]|nr:transketolase [Flavobacteriaceae bacterium UJ101]
MTIELKDSENKLSFKNYKQTLLDDFRLVMLSRELSLIGRKEVLSGRSQFGIVGDGKELPQIAMAKVFKEGDFRSGYYRDQTFMMAIGQLPVSQFFAQVYTHAGIENDPHSGARQMTCHYGTRSLNEDGTWKDLTKIKNSSADVSTTSGQMPRLLGLAQASKLYRNLESLSHLTHFSSNGNEVAFGTIGNASCAEGNFFETMNAAAVIQGPMIISVWDDDYGISVQNDLQVAKSDISEALKGFQRTPDKKGFEIIKVKGWDYPALVEAYERAEKIAREEHVPVLVHVIELTQPQGHSTSGSHERYKSKERLEWEREYDCIVKFREWLLSIEIEGENIFTEEELNTIHQEVKKEAKEARKAGWNAFQNPMKELKSSFLQVVEPILGQSSNKNFIQPLLDKLKKERLLKRDIYTIGRKILRILSKENIDRSKLSQWLEDNLAKDRELYSSHLYSESKYSPLKVEEVEIEYADDAPMVDARLILRDNFDALFNKHPELVTFGEDTGKIGGVNQCFEGLQEKYGEERVGDTGIRETTILGQGIGLAMRGLRPIAEIQYLDYIYYAASQLTDDLATVHYRSAGGQKAPVIVRTRGHRLVGIWHSGSPLGALVGMLRGIHVLVPRNMTQAAGFYNTLAISDDPALVIEPLNGYRLKEKMPSNLGEFRIPLGKVETTREGKDITVVTYGSTWSEVTKAAQELAELDIEIEIIDAQSLLPFDLDHDIIKSVQKTNRLVVIDEDVPGGGSSFILQKILEEQDAYHYLDSKPLTITAVENRTPSGFDGDYFSKPQVEDIVEKIYEFMQEVNPGKYEGIY